MKRLSNAKAISRELCVWSFSFGGFSGKDSIINAFATKTFCSSKRKLTMEEKPIGRYYSLSFLCVSVAGDCKEQTLLRVVSM